VGPFGLTRVRIPFRDLPPGDYFITAVPDMEASDLADVSFLDRLIAGAVKIRIDEGE
jgi:hypothetical protein